MSLGKPPWAGAPHRRRDAGAAIDDSPFCRRDASSVLTASYFVAGIPILPLDCISSCQGKDMLDKREFSVLGG